MKKRMFQTLSILGILTLMACKTSPSTSSSRNGHDKDVDLAPQSQRILNQKFNLDIFNAAFSSEVAKNPDGNFLVAPTSIKLALGLLLLGAQGDTEALLAEVLGYAGAPAAEVAKEFQELMKRLGKSPGNKGGPIEFHIANGLFLTGTLPLKKTFLDQALKFYQAKPQTVKDVRPINTWVKEKTHGHIPRILDKLDVNSLAVLVNALYFEGTWLQVYEKGHDSFTTNSQHKLSRVAFAEYGEKSRRQGVLREEYARINEGGQEFAVLKKKYVRADGAPALSMYFVLPPKGVSANYVATQTIGSPKFWAQVDSSLQETELLEAKFPIVELGSNIDLKGPLTKLQGSNGQSLGHIFEKADLKGLSDRADYVGQAKHRTFMKIDEKGTVAAAATAVEVVMRASIMTEPPPSFIVDRPYMIALRDDDKGEFIFLGVINDPTAKQ